MRAGGSRHQRNTSLLQAAPVCWSDEHGAGRTARIEYHNLCQIEYYHHQWINEWNLCQAPVIILRPTCRINQSIRKSISHIKYPSSSMYVTPFTALRHGPRKQKVEWTNELDIAFKQLKAVLAKKFSYGFSKSQPTFWYIHWCLWLSNGGMHYARRPSSSLLLEEIEPSTTQLHHQRKGIACYCHGAKGVSLMLLGADITIFTDHMNLTRRIFTTSKVRRWRICVKRKWTCSHSNKHINVSSGWSILRPTFYKWRNAYL